MKRGIEHPKYKHGFRAGYSEWRYGAKVPPKRQEPVFPPDQRAFIVARLVDFMGNWKGSPFQHEGTCRHHIRAVLCLKGYSWRRSNAEAASLVGEALVMMRARRPSWDEGQPDHSISEDYCKNCGGPLDEESLRRNHKHCSPECARATIANRNFEQGYWAHELGQAAHNLVVRARHAPRACAECSSVFRPYNENSDQKYCSMHCAAKARRTVPERPCEHCGTMFVPSNGNKTDGGTGRFCSIKCKNAARSSYAFEKHCAFCGDPFIAKGKKATHCSTACLMAERKIRNGGVPAGLKRHVFDHFFTVPANTLRSAYLTPSTLDKLLAA